MHGAYCCQEVCAMKTSQGLLLLAACIMWTLETKAQQPTGASSPTSPQNTSASETAKDSANTAAAKKSKKVWSEDDLHKLCAGVSVVVDSKPETKTENPANYGSKNSTAAHDKG